MPRLPLCLLLSLALHIACGGLLHESFALVGEARAETLPLVVQLVDLPALAPSQAAVLPATAVAQSLTPAASTTPESSAVALPAKTPALKQTLRAPSKSAVQVAHQPVRPATAAKAQASVASAALAKAVAPAVAARPAVKQEVLSLKPAFHVPPKPPRYPSQARRRNQQGVVMVEVRLDEYGAQRELKVLRSSGVASLDQAALEAVAVWRFQAEVRDGQSVPSRVQIPIQFALTANR
jgi:protein TonB